MFTREWILTTILVLLGTALCIRLGIWQLDRLEQRRTFNAHIEAMWASPALSLPEDHSEALIEMEYRSVCAEGEYDYVSQVALRNQYWQDRYGYHLLTPLIFGDGQAVMVDRGWIPAEGNESSDDWRKYDGPSSAEVCGIIRLGREAPDVGGRPDPTAGPEGGALEIWNNVNLERLDGQINASLLPVYLQVDPVEGDESPPIPYQPEVEISEGPHLGYAGQWFTFATILFVGYPFWLRRREQAT
jgi:surfeit locus 1 family protein